MNDDKQQRMIDAVHTYVRALNMGDLEAIMALYATDATVEDPVGSPPRVGHAAIRDSFAVAMSSMKFVVALDDDIYFSNRACASPFNVNISWEGQSAMFHSIDVFEFDAVGRIMRMRGYFDASNISDMTRG